MHRLTILISLEIEIEIEIKIEIEIEIEIEILLMIYFLIYRNLLEFIIFASQFLHYKFNPPIPVRLLHEVMRRLLKRVNINKNT
jgi:hypothetical protein